MSDLFDFLNGNRNVRRRDTSTVRRNRLDDGVLQDMTDKAELFSKARNDTPAIDIDGKTKKLDHWGELVGDVFRTLHTVEDPGVLEADEVVPSHEPNRRVMQRFIGTEDFSSMKPNTKGDAIASAFGAMRAVKELQSLATTEMEGMHKEAKNAENAEKRIERAEQKAEAIREQIREQLEQGKKPAATPEQKAELDKAMKSKLNARQDLAKAQKAMADMPITVGGNAKIEKAAKDAKEGVEVVASLPGMGQGEKEQLNADDALRLAAMFADNPKLFEIARMLGRLLRDMRYKRARRITGGVEEVVDVKLGRDLPHVFPSQKMLLMDDDMELIFMRRFMQHALLQRERQGTTEAGRGPLVAVVDESYSMSDMRFIWSKALTMAITAIARKEQRDAAVVSFSSSGQLAAWEFPWKSRMDVAAYAEMAGHKFGGGTDITQGMEKAEEIIAKDERFTRADIVLITDGEDRWNSDDTALIDRLKNRAIRIHGIQVGGPPSDYMTNACESVASAIELTGANAASDLLAENIH